MISGRCCRRFAWCDPDSKDDAQGAEVIAEQAVDVGMREVVLGRVGDAD